MSFTNLGQATFRQEKTANNYDFSAIKSGLQKYIRRSKPNKAIYCATELALFKDVSNGKRCLTNFHHRLQIIMLEDIGLANPTLLLYFDKVDKTDLKQLTLLIKFMANSAHTRLYSLIKFIQTEPIITTAPLSEELSVSFPELKVPLTNFIYHLTNKSIYAWCFANQIINSPKLPKKILNSNNPAYLVFHIMFRIFTSSFHITTLQICLRFFKELKVKEAPICLFHPMYVYIFDLSKQKTFSYSKITNQEYESNFNSKIILDDYVIDMHTKEGRKNNRTSAQFAVEGSLVAFDTGRSITNSYDQLLNAYVQGKIRDNPPEREDHILIYKARAQLTCSDSKACVYAATYNKSNVIVKGPYLTLLEVSVPFQLYQIMKFFSKVNYLQANIMYLFPSSKTVPLGVRRRIDTNKPHYFLVCQDLYGRDNYDVVLKSSKLWKDEPVIDQTKLPNYRPEALTEEGRLSLIYQLCFRYAFEIGDFANRNFVVVNNIAYNVDVENIFVNNFINWNKTDREFILNTYNKYKQEINITLNDWLKDYSMRKITLTSKWAIIQKTLNINDEQVDRIKNNIKLLLTDFCSWISKE